jgi:dipicolinate synthase subunit B
MAIKAHLRNQRPVVIAVSTNDGLGLNAKNIATLINTKNIYMVPFGQDDPVVKPNSLAARPDKLLDTICCALEGKQIQPVLV